MRVGQNQTLVLGPPGCGKTTDLLRKVEQSLAAGIKPNRIGFVSFTRKAILEATARACEKFNLHANDFPFFKTIHSLCFMLVEAKRDDMMGRANYKELGQALGYKFEGTFDESETGLPQGGEEGDKLLFLDNFARVTMQPLKQAWNTAMADVNWFALERLSTALKNYKDANGLLDFTDLLQRVVDRKFNLPLDVVFIDEAQDLSQLQWAVLEVVFRDVPVVCIAGDDDQSIYRWSGADVETFLSLPGKKQVLSQSYRLPRQIFSMASKIISHVDNRYDKPYEPMDKEGSVHRAMALEEVQYENEGTTLCLARNVYLLERYEEHLRTRGIIYSKRGGYASVKKGHVEAILAWETLRRGQAVPAKAAKYVYDNLAIGSVLGRGGKAAVGRIPDDVMVDAELLKKDYKLLTMPIWHDALENIEVDAREYYLAIMRNGGKLRDAPRVMINTVHGVKGGEADHVIVLSDMSYRTHHEFQKDPDSEHRVAYVAVTRTKERLTIVQPQQQFAYPYQE